jgi:hypothetical protein
MVVTIHSHQVGITQSKVRGGLIERVMLNPNRNIHQLNS